MRRETIICSLVLLCLGVTSLAAADNWWKRSEDSPHTNCGAIPLVTTGADLVGGPYYYKMCPASIVKFTGTAWDLDCHQPCPFGQPDLFVDEPEDDFNAVWNIYRYDESSPQLFATLGGKLNPSSSLLATYFEYDVAYRGQPADVDDTPPASGADDPEDNNESIFTPFFGVSPPDIVGWELVTCNKLEDGRLEVNYRWHANCGPDYVPNLVDSSTALSRFLLYATLTPSPSDISSSSAALSIHRSR